jgi:hypothetical protein
MGILILKGIAVVAFVSYMVYYLIKQHKEK